MTDRDRDATGRARQGRPRDALGRPLAYGSAGELPIPEEALSPEETLRVAQGLLDQDRPFAAHEVFEARWKAGPAAERDLWQGLAQLAVAVTHAQRGNAAGARRLLARADERLQKYAGGGGPAYGLDLAQVRQRAAASVELAISGEQRAD